MAGRDVKAAFPKLDAQIKMDSKGFVKTGMAVSISPFLPETSQPGIFAAGGVRPGSVKRAASFVGDGAMAVRFVHEYLKEL